MLVGQRAIAAGPCHLHTSMTVRSPGHDPHQRQRFSYNGHWLGPVTTHSEPEVEKPSGIRPACSRIAGVERNDHTIMGVSTLWTFGFWVLWVYDDDGRSSWVSARLDDRLPGCSHPVTRTQV